MPDHLRAEIARLEAEVERLAHEKHAAERDLMALRHMLAERERLHPGDQRGYNSSRMVTAERVRVSGGREEQSRLHAAANDADYTVRSLAEALKAEGFRVSHSLLSQAHAGAKSISEKLARRIQERLGVDEDGKLRFPASRRNWPRIRIGE